MRANKIALSVAPLALMAAGFFVYALIRQVALGTPIGDRPAPTLILVGMALLILPVSIGTFVLLLFGHLRTEVREDGLRVQLWPLTKEHRYRFEEIRRAEARSYHPIREYGGWGIRWGLSGKALNISGDRGVQLELADGKKLLIGSNRSEELAETIRRAGHIEASSSSA